MRTQRVPVPDGSAYRIIIQPEEIEELFDSTVPAVLNEIEIQLGELRQNAGPVDQELLLLVTGGFAGSRYLQESIRLHFGERVAVIVPENPAAAVMFGAVPDFAIGP